MAAVILMLVTAAAVFTGLSLYSGRSADSSRTAEEPAAAEPADAEQAPEKRALEYDRSHFGMSYEPSTGESYYTNEIIVFTDGEDADPGRTLQPVTDSEGGPQLAGVNGYDHSALLRWDGEELSYGEMKEKLSEIRQVEGIVSAALNYAVLSEGKEAEEASEEHAGLSDWDAQLIRPEKIRADAEQGSAGAKAGAAYTDIGVINSDPELDASVDRILEALDAQGDPVRPAEAAEADSVFALNIQMTELIVEKKCRVICLNIQQPLVSFSAAQGNEYAQQFIRLQSSIIGKSMQNLEQFIAESGSGLSGCVICTSSGDQKSFAYDRDETAPYGFVRDTRAGDYSEEAMELRNDWAGCHAKWTLYNRIRMDAEKQKKLPHIQMLCTGSIGRDGDEIDMSPFSYTGYPVEVLAPGEDLWDEAEHDSGSILAAAHTAGIAADAFALNGELSPRECRDLIAEHLDPMDGFRFLLNGENVADSLAQARPSGWQKQDGAWVYYSDDGKAAKGYTLIGGVPYYFEKGGVPAERGWIDGTYYCDGKGRLHQGWLNDQGKACFFYMKETDGYPAGTWAKDTAVPGGFRIPESGFLEGELGETCALAIDALDQTGWDLQGAYRYSAATDYADYEARYGMRIHKAALQALKYREGNCISWSAEFCIMAKLLGYDCRQIWGYLGKGTEQPHSWTEIHDGSEIRIFDPRHEEGLDTSGFDVRYGQKGTYRYDENRKTYLKL